MTLADEHWAWIQANRRQLERHLGEYVAVGDDGTILAAAASAGEVIDAGRASGQGFWLFFVPISWRGVRVLPIRVRALRRTPWEPLYPVVLTPDSPQPLQVAMLVDSGADVTCIPYELGHRLGLRPAKHERVDEAHGFGGALPFLGRELPVEIDGHRLSIPVAWVQGQTSLDPILGRDVVFDCFDVLIAQRDQTIRLTWRGPAADA